MNADWRIRKATVEDAKEFQECMEKAYSPYLERFSGIRLPPMDADYADEIKNYPTWVADSNGSIGGGLMMMFEGESAKLANIAVHPKFQGQGLGGRLMKYAESIAKEKGHHELRFATHVLLTENVSLYRHLGWTEVDRDETRVRMKKDI
eukprot:Nk52_evm39s2340 gene=Nk52_evmTU39s2340